jgi:hypothetical protein
MAKEAKQFSINGNDYLITMFAGLEGLKVSAKLTKVLAPMLLPMVGIAGNEIKESDKAKLLESKNNNSDQLDDFNAKSIQALSVAISSGFDDRQIVELIQELLKVVVYKNQSLSSQLDTHLAGNYGCVIPLCIEVVKHNGFFDLIAGLKSMVKI